MGLIKVGKRAPDFAATDGEGNTVRLGNYGGRKLVLYFYPKDMTPGCTIEAEDFTRWVEHFRKAGVAVLGVSPDSPEQHHRFIERKKLKIRLLSDPDHTVSQDYGVWQEKNLYGHKHWGIVRTTYLIDEEGRIEKVWEKVKVDQHARAVLAYVRKEKGWKPKKKTKTAKKKTAKKKTTKKKTTEKKTAKKKAAKKKTKKKVAKTKKKTAKKKTTKKKTTKKKTAKKKTAKKKTAKKKKAAKKTAKKKAKKKATRRR